MKPTRLEAAALLIAAGIISYHIFIPPLIGLADSGDFGRITPWRGLSHVPTEYDQMYFSYFNSKYRIIPKWDGPDWYLTSTSLLIAPARWISIRIGQDQYFDIRILSSIHLAIFLIGLWLIFTASRGLTTALRVALFSLLVLIFADVGYIAYFNSFYSEATALSFLAIAVGGALLLLAEHSNSIWVLVVYFLATGMLTTSKPQYVLLVPLLASFGIYLSKGVQQKYRYLVSGVLAVTVFGITVWYYNQTPQSLKIQGAYVQIFMDLLPHSSTPEDDLSALGLDPGYAKFTGTTPYQSDSPLNNPKIHTEFSNAIDSFTIPIFYLSHPERLYGLCIRCSQHVFSTRVSRLGYYEANTGRPPLSRPFGVWSFVRENVFPRSVIFLGAFFATSIVALALTFKSSSTKTRGMLLLYSLFVLTAILQFFVAVTVGGGEPDLEKHLFMFNLAFDACVVLFVLGAFYSFQGSKYRLSSRFGPKTTEEGESKDATTVGPPSQVAG